MCNDEKNQTAFLTNSGIFSSFIFGDKEIRFRTSPKLNRYTEVIKWDSGYLVVTADYQTLGLTEEYIDISSILNELYFNTKKENGDTVVKKQGMLTDRELRKLQQFIKDNYKEMYKTWSSLSSEGFYKK